MVRSHVIQGLSDELRMVSEPIYFHPSAGNPYCIYTIESRTRPRPGAKQREHTDGHHRRVAVCDGEMRKRMGGLEPMYLYQVRVLFEKRENIAWNTKEKPKSATIYYLIITLMGFDITPILSMNSAVQRVLDLLYQGTPRPTQPILPEYLSKSERNERIRTRFAGGESIADLAHACQNSDQRVFQILHPGNR